MCQSRELWWITGHHHLTHLQVLVKVGALRTLDAVVRPQGLVELGGPGELNNVEHLKLTQYQHLENCVIAFLLSSENLARIFPFWLMGCALADRTQGIFQTCRNIFARLLVNLGREKRTPNLAPACLITLCSLRSTLERKETWSLGCQSREYTMLSKFLDASSRKLLMGRMSFRPSCFAGATRRARVPVRKSF